MPFSALIASKGQQVLTKFLELESMISQVSKSVSTILIPHLVQISEKFKKEKENVSQKKNQKKKWAGKKKSVANRKTTCLRTKKIRFFFVFAS